MTSRPNRLIFLVAVLAGCAGAPGAPSQQTQAPAVSPTSPPAPTAVTTGQPTPPPTAAPPQNGEPDLYIGGTITWTAQTSRPNGDRIDTQSVSGTANIVIHVINPSDMYAERGTGNTYSYDYGNNYTCASSHEEGTLESYVGGGGDGFPDYSIGMLNVGGRVGEDLDLQIVMEDYCGPTLGDDAGRVPDFSGFPECEPFGPFLYARFDGVENYVVDCDAIVAYNGVDNDVGTVSGHVLGTLSALDGPQL